MVFRWIQVTLSLQDFSQNPSRSEQCCGLYGLTPSSDFQFLVLFQAFVGHSKRTNNWFHCHPHVPQLSYFPGKVQVFECLFTFFKLLLGGPPAQQKPRESNFFLPGL